VKLQAVVFDWAGTVVDHGSRAPVAALMGVFAEACVPITVAEARQSMGIAKRDHIAAILRIPRVAGEWQRVHGVAPAESDTRRLYDAFIPKQTECLAAWSDVIDGVASAVEQMRSWGLRIGSTTGYTRPMLNFLLDHARAQGFSPDYSSCPDDVGGGRPRPWMCYRNSVFLRTGPLNAMVKIGDTPSDIEEGRNAGMWTIGITRTGNEVGLTAAEWSATRAVDRPNLVAAAEKRLRAAGAQYTAQSVGDCLEAIERIDARYSAGESPV
jgi:phosphonoacetaldehyde hydrolase